jgi:chlorite dismutase
MNQATSATNQHTPTEGSPHGDSTSRRPTPEEFPASLVPHSGWHFLHLFYKIDRAALRGFSPEEKRLGREAFTAILGAKPEGVEQFQAFAVPGHKADFGLMLAGPDVKAIHGVQNALAASPLGAALHLAYSYVSLTEVLEYFPSPEQYSAILRDREKLDPESPTYKTKVAAYIQRYEPLTRQRLTPEFPDWPCLCFYPMSKTRQGEQNWYVLPFERRSELMSRHGQLGRTFAGKVSQLITGSTGLDDWEWGVTLWARNPEFLKDIVYDMRFDETSAKYAAFGDFYFGYILPPEELVEVLRI